VPSGAYRTPARPTFEAAGQRRPSQRTGARGAASANGSAEAARDGADALQRAPTTAGSQSESAGMKVTSISTTNITP